jgi:hypothetical protein
MTETRTNFNNDGLLIHELEVHNAGGDAIGVTIDGANHITRNTWKRFGTLRKGIQAVLNRDRIAGWVLEVVLGHCTYFSLVLRDVLCVFHACYRFVQRHYSKASFIWAEVRNELRAFKGMMIFVASRWDLQWSDVVYSVDASLSGYGIVKSKWALSDVRQVGRVDERSRYKLGATNARSSALHLGVSSWMQMGSWLNQAPLSCVSPPS